MSETPLERARHWFGTHTRMSPNAKWSDLEAILEAHEREVIAKQHTAGFNEGRESMRQEIRRAFGDMPDPAKADVCQCGALAWSDPVPITDVDECYAMCFCRHCRRQEILSEKGWICGGYKGKGAETPDEEAKP